MNCLAKLTAAMAAAVVVTTMAPSIASAQYPNPVVTQRVYNGSSYDPWNDHWSVSSTRVRVRASAYDPTRTSADPGSVRNVHRYVRDVQGGLWLESGTTWTSYGVPHGNLSRTRYWSAPGITGRRTDVMSFDH